MICNIIAATDSNKPAFASSMLVALSMNEVKDLMLLRQKLRPDQSGRYINL
jgi:hypothetical protein